MISLSGFSDRSLVVFVDRTSQDTRSRLVNINYETRFDGILQRLGLTESTLRQD